MAYIMATAALATMLDITSEKYGKDAGETRSMLLKIGQEVDAAITEAEIVG